MLAGQQFLLGQDRFQAEILAVGHVVLEIPMNIFIRDIDLRGEGVGHIHACEIDIAGLRVGDNLELK